MFKRLGFCVGLLAFVVAGHVQAAEPQLLGTYGDWLAYRFSENGNKVCYMASKPKKDEGKYSRRGDIFALVTHRPADGTKDVFSYIAGYTYKTGSDVTVDFGDEQFVLFTKDDTAWGLDSQTDAALSKAIQKGSKFVVKGMSSRGTATKDTFSLKGSTAAYNKITDECK